MIGRMYAVYYNNKGDIPYTLAGAKQHHRLYSSRMPWKVSRFNNQIVPGYIRPVPELKIILPRPNYFRFPVSIKKKSLRNFTPMFLGHDKHEEMERMDYHYLDRVQWKRLTRSFVDYVYREYGYAFDTL